MTPWNGTLWTARVGWFVYMSHLFGECIAQCQVTASYQTNWFKTVNLPLGYCSPHLNHHLLSLHSQKAGTHSTIIPDMIEGCVYLSTALQVTTCKIQGLSSESYSTVPCFNGRYRDKHNCLWWDSILRSLTPLETWTITKQNVHNFGCQ